MSRKKAIKINLGISQDLESQLEKAEMQFKEVSSVISNIEQLENQLSTKRKTSSETLKNCMDLKSKLEVQVKELGLNISDMPILSKANQIIKRLGDLNKYAASLLNR